MVHPLLQYLRKNGLTQPEFARRIGVSLNTVNRWIHGEMLPRPKYMQRIIRETGGEVGVAKVASFYHALREQRAA